MAGLARLEFEKATGQLLNAELVKSEAFATCRIVRDRLMNVAPRLAGILAGGLNKAKQDWVHKIISDEVRDALMVLGDPNEPHNEEKTPNPKDP